MRAAFRKTNKPKVRRVEFRYLPLYSWHGPCVGARAWIRGYFMAVVVRIPALMARLFFEYP